MDRSITRRTCKAPLLLSLIVAAFLMAGCSQTVDVSIYVDGSWKLQSTITSEGDTLSELEKYIPDIIAQLDLPIDPDIDWKSSEETLIKGGLDTLVAYYGSKSIDFQYTKQRSDSGSLQYAVSASGRDLDSFQALLPGTIELDAPANGQYRLKIQLGKANMLSRSVYKQDISLHAQEISETNAPQLNLEKTDAGWPNPEMIEVVFVPAVEPTPTPVPTVIPTPGPFRSFLIDVSKNRLVPWVFALAIVSIVAVVVLTFLPDLKKNTREAKIQQLKKRQNVSKRSRMPGQMRGSKKNLPWWNFWAR